MDEPQQDFLFSLLVIRRLGAQDGLGFLPRPLVGGLWLGASSLGRRQGIIAELALLAAVTTCWFRLVALECGHVSSSPRRRSRVGSPAYLLAEPFALATSVARLLVAFAASPDFTYALERALGRSLVRVPVRILIFICILVRILIPALVEIFSHVLIRVVVPSRVRHES